MFSTWEANETLFVEIAAKGAGGATVSVRLDVRFAGSVNISVTLPTTDSNATGIVVVA